MKYLLYIPLLILTGCATIVKGPTQDVQICTNPEKADVWIDGCYMGRTPMRVNLTRRHCHRVTLDLDGFETSEFYFDQTLNGWVFGNILIGGPIGVVIDAASGSIWQLTPKQVEIDLCQKLPQTCCAEKGESFIAIVKEADSNWKKVGELSSHSH